MATQPKPLSEAFPAKDESHEAARARAEKYYSDRRLTRESRGTGVGGGESPESAAQIARGRAVAWNHDRAVLLAIDDPIARARYYISSVLCPTPFRMTLGSMLHYLRTFEGYAEAEIAAERDRVLAALSAPTPHPIAKRVS